MAGIIEAADLPEGEKVYLKKDWLGWRVVEPIKDPETGKTNYMSLLFGGKKGLVMLAVIIVICLLMYLGIQELIGNYRTIAEEPCKYCVDCLSKTINKINIPIK